LSQSEYRTEQASTGISSNPWETAGGCGQIPKILKVFDAIRKLAPTGSTVLLSGESGTGKELFTDLITCGQQKIMAVKKRKGSIL